MERERGEGDGNTILNEETDSSSQTVWFYVRLLVAVGRSIERKKWKISNEFTKEKNWLPSLLTDASDDLWDKALNSCCDDHDSKEPNQEEELRQRKSSRRNHRRKDSERNSVISTDKILCHSLTLGSSSWIPTKILVFFSCFIYFCSDDHSLTLLDWSGSILAPSFLFSLASTSAYYTFFFHSLILRFQNDHKDYHRRHHYHRKKVPFIFIIMILIFSHIPVISFLKTCSLLSSFFHMVAVEGGRMDGWRDSSRTRLRMVIIVVKVNEPNKKLRSSKRIWIEELMTMWRWGANGGGGGTL